MKAVIVLKSDEVKIYEGVHFVNFEHYDENFVNISFLNSAREIYLYKGDITSVDITEEESK